MSAFAELRAGVEAYPGCKLVQVIGRGGFAEVWEAERDGARLALKFVPANNTMVAAHEVRSIQCIRRLQHPHLIPIDQVWCQHGCVVVSMELAEGSLHDLFIASLEEFGAPLAPRLVIHYLKQAADVIDFLNSRQHLLDGQRVGFQHCDIKPSNLLLCGDTVKLCDFGLASPTSAALRTHRRAGTPDFTAPEVFQGRLSNWTDQYALAVSYCQLRGGRLPFSISPRGFQEAYVRPAPDLSMLPREERPIIARALAPVPLDRWPSCTDLIARLGAFLETSELGSIPVLVDNVVENPKLLESDMEI